MEKSRSEASSEPALPIVDEIEQLIAKEKLLSELRLIEARNEARLWRERAQGGERPAEQEGHPIPESAAPQPSKEEILASCTELLDLSGIPLDQEDLRVVQQLVFFRRKAASPVRTVLLRNCGLDAQAVSFVSSMLSDACAVEALDLSLNNFGNELIPCITEALKLRRHPLHSLLLHGNTAISSFPKSADFVKYFGPSTTAISVSFQDNPPEPDPKSTATSTPKMLSRFLTELASSLESKGSETAGPKKRTSKTRSTVGSVQLNSNSGIECLHSLGVTHVNPSRLALGLLAKVLKLSSSTLLHLDLRFAFTGYAGARAISEVLVLPECQLLHICLKGNLISDVAVRLLTSALVKNRTLVDLDLSSNLITFQGASELIRTLTSPSSFNPVLHSVDFRRNRLSLSEMAGLGSLAYDNGAIFRVRHDQGRTSTALDSHSLDRIVLLVPGLVSRRTSGSVTLYSVDVSKLPSLSSENGLSACFSMRLSVPKNCLVAGAKAVLFNAGVGAGRAVALCSQDLDYLLLSAASAWVEFRMWLQTTPTSGQLVLKVSFDTVNSSKYRDLAEVFAKDFRLLASHPSV